MKFLLWEIDSLPIISATGMFESAVDTGYKVLNHDVSCHSEKGIRETKRRIFE
jgi:hypothetical protein